MRFTTFAQARDWFLARFGGGEATKRRSDEGVKAVPAIEFFTTEELMDELQRRCHIVVAGFVTLTEPEAWTTFLAGPRIGVRGMAAELRDEARRFRKGD